MIAVGSPLLDRLGKEGKSGSPFPANSSHQDLGTLKLFRFIVISPLAQAETDTSPNVQERERVGKFENA
jgi:hypothetical protein